MAPRFLVLALLFVIGKSTFSQPDSIWSLPHEQQLITLLTWYNTCLANNDSQQLSQGLATAEKRFAKKDNKLLQRQAWLLQQVFNAEKNPSAEKRANIMLEAAAEAGENDWSLTEAECLHFAGDFYFRESKYMLAFEYMKKAQILFDKYSAQPNSSYVHRYANVLANCYYHFGDYQEAVTYLKKSIQLPASWNAIIFTPGVYNTLALCYQHLKQYDSAAIWYNKSHEAAVAFKDSFYMSLAHGNLGFIYFLQKQYDKALPLLEADYRGSIKAMEMVSAANAAITIAAIYMKKDQLEIAQRYMDLSRPYVYGSGNLTLKKHWYENLYNISKVKADHKNAGLYADSLMAYTDSVTALRDKKAFNQAVLRLETEKHMNEVNQLDNKRKHQIFLRNSLLAGLVLMTIIALLWVNRQLLKRNKERELTQQQLRFAEQELINYTGQLKEKNELLEQLRDEINKEHDLNDREGNLNRLLEATILTEEDWKKFRQLFEKVYPGFFRRLKEKMPDLSVADTRLLALSKLQLVPKDMASMLGVSYDAVKKARQRLRKKIHLPEEGTLDELVEMI